MHGQKTCWFSVKLCKFVCLFHGNASKNFLWYHKNFVSAYGKLGRFPWQNTKSVAFLAAISYFLKKSFQILHGLFLGC